MWTAFPCLHGSLIGAGRNARSRAMTGVFGPGPRDMAVCHVVARPTHEYKNPLPLSQVRAGGRTWLVSGGRRAPHPPPNALFSEGWAGGVARQTARLCWSPGTVGEGMPGKMWRKARWCPMPWRQGKRHERETDGPLFVRCRGAGPSAGQGREERRQTGSLCGALEGWRGHEGKRSFSAGDGRRRPRGLPVMTQVAPGTGSGDGVPFPSGKELSSRSIPGRWPCP